MGIIIRGHIGLGVYASVYVHIYMLYRGFRVQHTLLVVSMAWKNKFKTKWK